MDKNSTDEHEPLDYGEHAGAGFPDPEDRDYACILLPDLDYEAQLRAIHDLLRRHRQATNVLSDEIREIDADARRLTSLRNQQAVDEWLERMHHSVYQDAAHSMAAVGMIAPLVESVFYQALLKLREHMPFPLRNHDRWQHQGDKQWDCHFVWRNDRWQKSLVDGIADLTAAVGLACYLPRDLALKLEALFLYRNKMFHNGFEWPIAERRRFAVHKRAWPENWFIAATSGAHPWIFYMTDEFIDEWVNAIDQLIESIGAFTRALADGSAAQQGDADGRPLRGRR